MYPQAAGPRGAGHSHVFLGVGHAANERKTWAVIVLCSLMMLLEIGGGALFGSLAVVADGFHMATHAVAILIAALAYRFARRHASDRRFTFGTGKVGDLAGFSSALILGMIALLVGYEAVVRLFQPVVIHFSQAIPIAVLGLGVNIVSAWLLSGSSDHSHRHGHHHGHSHAHALSAAALHPRHDFRTADAQHQQTLEFAEFHPFVSDATHRDHNFRSAFVHVPGDAAVSLLAIVGLFAAKFLSWPWVDPLMGLVGAVVIAAWAYSLVRSTTKVLVDVTPDPALEERIRRRIELDGDAVSDLHLWRLGPGHLGAIVSVRTSRGRNADFYKSQLQHFGNLSHVTVEVLSSLSTGG